MRKVLFILGEFDDEDVDWMVDNGRKVVHPRGGVLIREGEPVPVISILLDGELSVTLSAMAGKEIARLYAGEVLGELSFLDSRPPSATVTAMEDVTVLSIPRETLRRKLEEDLGFAARFYRAIGMFLASRLRKTQLRLGYGDRSGSDEEGRSEDEMDPAVLDGVALAGARFDWMLKRLRAARGEARP